MTDAIPLLAAATALAAVTSLVLGVLAFVAFRRERRRQVPGTVVADGRFFVRYTLPEEEREAS